MRRNATPASEKADPYTRRTSRGPNAKAGIALTRATTIVVRVRTAGVRPATAPGAGEHRGAEGIRDVPERLRQAARDRVDPGRPDADDRVDDERIGAELESL